MVALGLLGAASMLVGVLLAVAHLAYFVRRQRYLLAVTPAAVLAAAVALLPLRAYAWAVERDYARKLAQRQEVVGLVEAGQVGPGITYERCWGGDARLYLLPTKYWHLTRARGAWIYNEPADAGKAILAYRVDGATHVVFFYTRGGFCEFSGVLYRGDGRDPRPPERFLHGDVFRSVDRLGDRWFWVNTW